MQSISVITVCFNAQKTIGDCIESVRNQTLVSEHVIIDGVSTDGTLDVVERYTRELAKVVSEPDRGVYDAMNKGVINASGDIVGILNADDMYYDDDVLLRVSRVFERDDVDACYGDLVYVDLLATNRVTRYWKSSEYSENKFYWGWMPPHPTFFVRRSLYEKYGLFRLDLGSAADYELMLRFLLANKVKATYIPHIQIKMRTGGVSNVSMRNRILANKMDRKAWQVNGLEPYSWTLTVKPLRKLSQWWRRPPPIK